MIRYEWIILFFGIISVIFYSFKPENKIVKKIKNIKEKIEEYKIWYIFKLRLINLIIRVFLIATLANYGAYKIYESMTSTVYAPEYVASANLVIFVMLQMSWIIPIYIYYDIFSTVYNLCNDIKEIGIKFDKNKLQKICSLFN